MQGIKYDKEKPQWHLVPWLAMEEVVKVLMIGAKKYSPDNWMYVEPYKERYFDACMRHVVAWQQGERDDKETKVNHIAHAICCLLFILWKELKNEKNIHSR